MNVYFRAWVTYSTSRNVYFRAWRNSLFRSERTKSLAKRRYFRNLNYRDG